MLAKVNGKHIEFLSQDGNFLSARQGQIVDLARRSDILKYLENKEIELINEENFEKEQTLNNAKKQVNHKEIKEGVLIAFMNKEEKVIAEVTKINKKNYIVIANNTTRYTIKKEEVLEVLG